MSLMEVDTACLAVDLIPWFQNNDCTTRPLLLCVISISIIPLCLQTQWLYYMAWFYRMTTTWHGSTEWLYYMALAYIMTVLHDMVLENDCTIPYWRVQVEKTLWNCDPVPYLDIATETNAAILLLVHQIKECLWLIMVDEDVDCEWI